MNIMQNLSFFIQLDVTQEFSGGGAGNSAGRNRNVVGAKEGGEKR
jgi:hypothetical protein